MKVLLVAVNGSYTHTNLAIRALRAPLEKEGFQVVLLECNLHERTPHILQDIISEKADIIGFSTYIWNCDVMYELASNVKKISPNARIVFGGPEVSYETHRFSNMKFMDAIICGEGEQALCDICECIRDKKEFSRITIATPYIGAMKDEGIFYREGDYPSSSMLYYEASRGCPYSCAYCLSSATHGVRSKSLENIRKDLESFEKLPENIKIIKFVDRTFNYDQNRANKIWSMLLEDEFTKNYHFEVCASLLNEESFDILRQFPRGKIQLEFGLQSTNEETLAVVSRHIDPNKVLESVNRIKQMGNIHVHLDLIAGLPFENYERFKKSFNDAYPTCDLLQLGFLKLLPGTKLREDSEKYGIKYTDKAPYVVLSTNWLSYEELVKLTKINEVCERICESGHFNESLKLVFSYTKDYFGFFEGLSKYIEINDGRRLQKISQPDTYRLFYGFSCEFLPEDGKTLLSEAIHKDFAACENRIRFKL